MHCLSLGICLLTAFCLSAAAQSVTADTTSPGGQRPLAPQEAKRKLMVEKMDKAELRLKTTAVVERSHRMLELPNVVKHLKGFTVAKEPPTVEFAVVPFEPRFFSEPMEPNGPVGLWSSWGQGRYLPEASKFYSAVGNHIYYDAQLYIVEYDPATKSVSLSNEINSLLGRKPTDFGDGKIHGWLDFYGETTTYFCTYWCAYPYPTEEQFASGYDGGVLASYDVVTGKLVNYGVPISRTSYPYHRVDRNRGLLYAVGVDHEFLVYDLKQHKAIWAGKLPDEMMWYDRNMMVDEQTGCVYSSNLHPKDPDVHFIKYDSNTNTFTKMKSCVPRNFYTGLRGQMRGHTGRKARDGWFMGVAIGGQMFKFYPDEDRVEDLGACWPGEPKHLYTTSMVISPDDKYVYYIPGAHGQAHYSGTPIVQFNTKTHERKVIAFLSPYLYNKYGYIASGTFSVDLDDKGERLFILFNGAFNEFDAGGADVFGDPSVVVVHIPESERK